MYLDGETRVDVPVIIKADGLKLQLSDTRGQGNIIITNIERIAQDYGMGIVPKITFVVQATDPIIRLLESNYAASKDEENSYTRSL
jgi:hypothetical protein